MNKTSPQNTINTGSGAFTVPPLVAICCFDGARSALAAMLRADGVYPLGGVQRRTLARLRHDGGRHCRGIVLIVGGYSLLYSNLTGFPFVSVRMLKTSELDQPLLGTR